MYCESCGQTVPNGAKTCMFCGAPVSGVAGSASGNPFKIDIPDESEKRKQYLGAISNLESLKTNRLVALIFEFITFFVTLWTLLGTNVGKSVVTILIVAAVAALIIGIWYLVIINGLNIYVDRFGTAFAFGVANIALSFLKAIVENSLISLAALVVALLFAYHFYGAMEELSRPVSRDIANRWAFLWKVTLIMLVGSIALGVAMVIAVLIQSVGGVILLTVLTLGLAVGVEVLEYVTVCKTVDAFSQEQR